MSPAESSSSISRRRTSINACERKAGNVVSEHCNELRIPNYKNVWANIRKIGRAPNADAVSFKALEMPQNI